MYVFGHNYINCVHAKLYVLDPVGTKHKHIVQMASQTH